MLLWSSSLQILLSWCCTIGRRWCGLDNKLLGTWIQGWVWYPSKSRQRSSSVILAMVRITDYGHPERAFFKNLELLCLGRYYGLKFFETLLVFSAGLSAPSLVYRGSPTITVSTNTISTSTNFVAIGIKLVLVEI